MILIAALTSILIGWSDMTVVTCDLEWLDQDVMTQMLDAELSELPAAEKSDLIVVVDQCTDVSVRLRVVQSNHSRERTITLAETPEAARLRTVVLALGELARETDIAEDRTAKAGQLPEKKPTAEDESAMLTQNAHSGNRAELHRAELPPQEMPQTRDNESSVRSKRSKSKTMPRASAQLLARGFPLAATVAPEARFGLVFPQWRIALGGYAMGWSDAMGTAYLTAFTLTGGPVLWQHAGKWTARLDLLTELGAVVAFGHASQDTVYTPKFNIAEGAHLAFRTGPNLSKGYRPELTIECGWLRGLAVYASDTFLGGFEGLSLAVGFISNW